MTTRNTPATADEKAPAETSKDEGWIANDELTIDIGAGKQIRFEAGDKVEHKDLPKGWPTDAVVAAGFVRRPGD